MRRTSCCALAEAGGLPGGDDADGEERRSRRRTSCTSAGPACTAPSGRTGRSTSATCSSPSAPASTTGSPGKLDEFAPGRPRRPPRRRPGRDLEAAPRGRPRRRPAASRCSPGSPASWPRSAGPAPRPWLRQLERLARGVPAPLRRGRRALLKPQRVLETLQALTAGRDDVIWTTGVGQHQMWAMQYLLLRPAALVHHLGRARHDGLRAARGDRREGRAARRDGRSAWTATARSR